MLEYQPRRPVPWRALDLVMVFGVYVIAVAGIELLIIAVLGGTPLIEPPRIQPAESPNAAHIVARLLNQGNAIVLLVCGLSAVVVAPVAEEFFFRVLLQGWLEAGQRRLRPAMPTLRRWVPGASGPIVLTALLFARIHFRVDTPMMNIHYLTLLLAGNAAANVLVMLATVCLLRMRAGATAVDFGWVPGKFFGDVGLGLAAFAAVAAPVYAMMITLTALMPKCIAPDPLVLFPFALVLGTLYWRTHRIVPAIVLHMALNATSLAVALAWIALQK